MRRLLDKIGVIFSYFFTGKISDVLRYCHDVVYTGWIRRQFKKFEGEIKGNISLINGQNISVGNGTVIHNNVSLFTWERHGNQRFNPEMIIGRNCDIQNDCFISCINKISIGDNVALTAHSMVLDNTHGDFQDNHFTFNENPDIPDVFLQNAYTRDLASKGPVIIENDVHIGMYCLLLPGAVIGHHSVVAAHSVVSRKIPPYSLVAGNPAEVIITFGRKKH